MVKTNRSYAKWVVECFYQGMCKKRRTFRSADDAMNFSNNWQDDHQGWTVTVITPSQTVNTVGINGNDKVKGLK